MTQNITWPPIGGQTFPIPEDGETNWPELTDFLLALSSAQGTKAQKVATRKITSTPSTISAANDCFVAVELGVPAPATVNLPAGNNGQYFSIIDGLGDAGTNNITVQPAPGETIQSGTEYIMNANGASVGIVFMNGDWKIVWQAAGEGSAGGIARSSIDSATPNYVVINDPSGKLSQEQFLSTLRGGLGANVSGYSGYIKMTAGVPSAVASIPGTDLSGGIAASKIGNGDVTNPILSHLADVTAPVQNQINGKLTTSTRLSNFKTLVDGSASAGLMMMTGAGVWAQRSIAAGSNRIVILNPTGAGGDPSVDIDETKLTISTMGGTLGVFQGGTSATTSQGARTNLLPSQAGNASKVLTTNGTDVSWAAAIGGYQTAVITANPSPAAVNTHYLTNTTSAGFTVTLPNGATGARIKISDDRGTWDVNNLTITPASGERIWPLAANASLTCNVIRGWIELVWDGAGWSPNSLASTTLGSAGGGLTGSPVTTTVNPAVNGVMYQADTTGGAFSIALPGGTSSAVIGVLDAGPGFTTNNCVIIPASGQSIDNGTANQPLIMDGNYQSVILYRANGASVWEIQVTPAVQYSPGFQPGYTSGTSITAGNVGESYEVTIAATQAALTNVAYPVGSFVLQPGNWKVTPVGSHVRGTVANNTYFIFDVNTSAALRTSRYTQMPTNSVANIIMTGYPLIVRNSAPQTVYFLAQYDFSAAGSSNASGVCLVERTA